MGKTSGAQRGMTLVELLVAMTVTVTIALGLGGLAFAGYKVIDQTTSKLDQVLGFEPGNLIAYALEKDGLLYHKPCSSSTDQLGFCLPDGTTAAVYSVQEGNNGGQVVRTGLLPADLGSQVVAQGPNPSFGKVTCAGPGRASILVNGLTFRDAFGLARPFPSFLNVVFPVPRSDCP